MSDRIVSVVLTLLPLVCLAPHAVAEEVALLRMNPDRSGKPLQLSLHHAEVGTEEFVGALTADDRKLFKAGGSRPVRHAFSADIDGNGKEELVLVRENRKKGGRLDLVVIRPPKQPGGKTGAKLASTKKGDLGLAVGDGRITALGAGDVDGDGRDELLIARRFDSGRTAVEVREFPPGVNRRMGPPIASDPDVGPAGDVELISLAGVNADQDPLDEIAALFRPIGQPDRLLVFDPPALPDSDIDPPIAEDADVSVADGSNLSIAPIDPEEDGGEGVLILREMDDGSQRIDVFSALFDGDLGAPTSSDPTPANPSRPVRFAFGVGLFGVDRSEWHFYPVNSSSDGGAQLFYEVGDAALSWWKGRGLLKLPGGNRLFLSMPDPTATGPVLFAPDQLTMTFPDNGFSAGSLDTRLPPATLGPFPAPNSPGVWIYSDDPPLGMPPTVIGTLTYDIGLTVDVHWIALRRIE